MKGIEEMSMQREDDDRVTQLISRCLKDPKEAERLFRALITENQKAVELPGGRIELSQKEHDEFVARYSSEVGPTQWESKRAKK